MKQEKHFKSVDSEPKLLVQLCIHNSTCLSTISSDTERRPDRSVILLTAVCALAEGAYSEARSGYGMSYFMSFFLLLLSQGLLLKQKLGSVALHCERVVSGHRGILRFLASELYQDLQ